MSVTATQPGRLQRRGDQTDADAVRRSDVLDAAERIFLRRGYHVATVDEIARSAGASKKTIYQLFVSKRALFIALLEDRKAPLMRRVPVRGRSAHEVLIELLGNAAELVLAPAQVGLFRLLMTEFGRDDRRARHCVGGGMPGDRGALEHSLAALAVEGQITLDDPREAARMLMGMALGEFHLTMLLGVAGAPSKARLNHRIKRSVGIFLSGVEGQGAALDPSKAEPLKSILR